MTEQKEPDPKNDERRESRALKVIRSLRNKKESPEKGLEEDVSYKTRMKQKAGSQRGAHRRKDAKAHVKKTRPHTKGGRSRATSRITRHASHRLSYGAKAKSKEGRFAQKQMMTRRKSSGLKRMRKFFRSSGRLDYVDSRRMHADTKKMQQTTPNRRSTHLRNSYEEPESQVLREKTVINTKKKMEMTSLDTIKEARKSLLTELLQNTLDRYGAKAQSYQGQTAPKVAGHPGHRKLKIKRDVVQTIRDMARSSQKSREKYVKQQQKMQDLEAARHGQ